MLFSRELRAKEFDSNRKICPFTMKHSQRTSAALHHEEGHFCKLNANNCVLTHPFNDFDDHRLAQPSKHSTKQLHSNFFDNFALHMISQSL